MVCKSESGFHNSPPPKQTGVSCLAGSPACSGGVSSYQAPLPGFEKLSPAPLPYDFNRCSKPLTDEALAILDKAEQNRTVEVGACLNIYPNGEITGGYYKTCSKPPPERKGRTISQEFTPKARKTIRRTVGCGLVTFKGFLTLTFDPHQSQLDETGKVVQSWAKQEFKRFMNSIKKVLDRKAALKGVSIGSAIHPQSDSVFPLPLRSDATPIVPISIAYVFPVTPCPNLLFLFA